jgi:hypothetical protein
MLSFIMLSVIMLSVSMLYVVMLNVVMLNVVAPSGLFTMPNYAHFALCLLSVIMPSAAIPYLTTDSRLAF